MPDEIAIDWPGASKMAKTQVEKTKRRSPPMSHFPVGAQYLCSLACTQAASALSFQEALLGNTEALVLTWAKRRHETLQETVNVLAKTCRPGDAVEWGAVCGDWWNHNVERFAADVQDLNNFWTRVYRSSTGADDRARLHWQ